MAYRRSLTTCVRLVAPQRFAPSFSCTLTTSARLLARQRFAPLFSCTHHLDNRKNWQSDERVKSFVQSRSYGCFGNNTNIGLGFGGMSFRDAKRSQFLHDVRMTTSGFLSARNMSTSQAMEVVSSQAAAVSEVAVAAVDSWLPVAVLQYAIDGIHIYTGLNWWASIIITNLVIRTLLLPITINQLRDNANILIVGQKLKQLDQEMQDNGMTPTVVADGRERAKRIYKEYGVTYFTPFKSFCIKLPVSVCYLLAILNMVEKVPSLQTGGISWFIDLTTADSFYILPFLTAFSFWLKAECKKRPDALFIGSNPANVIRNENIFTGCCVWFVILGECFPNALLCYWITSNLFYTVLWQMIKKPSVKKLLNIPIEPPVHHCLPPVYQG